MRALLDGEKPTESDIDEVHLFAEFIRKVTACVGAGMTRDEAARAIYADHYVIRPTDERSGNRE